MPSIAIIDDNNDQSSTLKKVLDVYLKKFNGNFDVITQYPFKDIELYFKFIEDMNVCVLILDERLNDQNTPEGEPVPYKGNQLVIELRERLKDFPIYMITAHANDTDLLAIESEFEALIDRGRIIADDDFAVLFIPRLIRSAQHFIDSNFSDLSEFNELAKQVAGGTADSEVIKRLEALQVKLELPFSGFDDRKAWLDEYEKQIAELEKLKDIIQKKIKE